MARCAAAESNDDTHFTFDVIPARAADIITKIAV